MSTRLLPVIAVLGLALGTVVLAQSIPTTPPMPTTATMMGLTFATPSGGTAINLPTRTLRFGTASDGCDLSWNPATHQLDELCRVFSYGQLTQVVQFAAGTLPTCDASADGSMRRDSVDDALKYCDGNSWKLLVNRPQYFASVVLPASLGILGIGGTSTATAGVTGAPVGSDCQVTCPSGVATVGKVAVSCSVTTVGVATVVAQSLSTLTLSLPALAADRTCGITVTPR